MASSPIFQKLSYLVFQKLEVFASFHVLYIIHKPHVHFYGQRAEEQPYNWIEKDHQGLKSISGLSRV